MDDELKEALATLASKQGVTGKFTSLVTMENWEATALLTHIEAQEKRIAELEKKVLDLEIALADSNDPYAFFNG